MGPNQPIWRCPLEPPCSAGHLQAGLRDESGLAELRVWLTGVGVGEAGKEKGPGSDTSLTAGDSIFSDARGNKIARFRLWLGFRFRFSVELFRCSVKFSVRGSVCARVRVWAWERR